MEKRRKEMAQVTCMTIFKKAVPIDPLLMPEVSIPCYEGLLHYSYQEEKEGYVLTKIEPNGETMGKTGEIMDESTLQ